MSPYPSPVYRNPLYNHTDLALFVPFTESNGMIGMRMGRSSLTGNLRRGMGMKKIVG